MRKFFVKCGAFCMCVTMITTFNAEACSPARDYIRETGFELVDLSEAIVVAEVTGEGEAGGIFGFNIRFKLIETLKGHVPDEFQLPNGYINNDVRPSDPQEISAPHPQSLHGPCNRSHFSKNTKYVLMLERAEDASWRRFGGPFTRNAEDYHRPQAYWVRAIKAYLEVQEQPDRMAQLDALHNIWKQNRDAEEGSFERALADDINIHLWSLSWRKPTAYLVRMYEALETAQEGAGPAPAPHEPSILDALKEDAELGLSPAPEEDLHRVRLSVLRQLHLGDHAAAADLVNRIVEDNPSAEELSSAILFFNMMKQRQRGINLFQTRGWAKAALGTAAELDLLYEAFLSLKPNEKEQADGADVLKWAENAFALSEMRRVRFGSGWGQAVVAEILHIGDYRARPNVTLALARSYDEDVKKWAEDEIGRLIDNNTANYDSAYKLPVLVLMQMFTGEETESLEQLICSGKAGRYAVAKYYGDLEPDYRSLELLRYIANAPLDEEDRNALILSVLAHAGKLRAQGDSSAYTNRRRLKDYRANLERLISGKDLFMSANTKPLSCALVKADD